MTDLGMSPLSNAYIRAENLTQMERFYPLTVFVCHECFLVQLPAVETPEEIFSDYAYFSSFSDSWLQHAALYCNAMTERFGLNEKSQVIEVASNDGYLLQYFVRRGIPVLGVEPAANVARAAVERGVPSVVKFFGSRTAEELKIEGITADLLLGNNVLAHVPELNDFVEGLRLVLKPSGVITMEFPHLLRLMTGNQFDTIYHEHFSYLSLFAVERVFATHGLNIFDIEELPTHGGSLRIYAQHDRGPFEPSHRVALMRAQEAEFGVASLETYSRFAAQVQETKRKLLAFLIETRGLGKRIVGYGAPAKGNTLLNYCGVRSDFLDYTVDRSPHKQGLFLPGTHIPICEPNRIRQTRPDYVLILPWNLKNEIIEQMSYIREWGGKFVLPIPSVEVVP
jgi:SAM-dependent methyltransferase